MSNKIQPEYPNPIQTLLHISDTHLVSQVPLYGSTVDPDYYLELLFTRLLASKTKPDAIIFTGDLADAGEVEAYRKLLKVVSTYTESVETQIIWAMGNHDNRENFKEILLGDSIDSSPVDKVNHVNGLRIISLDTSVPGHHYGEITESQLAWLDKELSTDAEAGTILAMHHPPVPSVLHLAQTVELRNQKALKEIVSGRDIRAIIAGHLHYSSFSTFAGIPVSVATSTCYTQDLNVEYGGTRGRDGVQGFNFMHVYEDTILHSVVPLSEGLNVGDFVNPEQVQIELGKMFL